MNEYLIPTGRLKVEKSTGAAAIAASITVARPAQLISVTVKFSAAPTTSQNLTVTKDAIEGAAYDVVLLSTDPSASSATSLVYQPDEPLWLRRVCLSLPYCRLVSF